MIITRRKAKNLILLLALFLFAEYLRIITENLFDRSADNLIFCLIAMIWAVYLKRRILDEGTRKILISLAMSIVFLFVVRTCKYVIFDKNTILWYMFYIPLTVMPLLVFFMAKMISGQQSPESRRADKIYLTALVVLNLMILTNDFHQLVFRFVEPGDIDNYNYGIGYYITIGWISIFVLAALYKLFKVCSLPQSRSRRWIPILVLLAGVIAIILHVTGNVPVINDTKIYLFQEIVLVMVISIVEACIYIGVIPSNDGYEEIFENSQINACITDSSGKVEYSSDDKHIISEELRLKCKDQKVMIDEYTRLHASPVNGGMLYYTEDIQEIVKLNHMLEESVEVISAENEIIEAQNKLLADEAMYKTKNKLYADIARIVRPQVLMIEECLALCEQEPESFSSHMAKASVLNAYIKRRVNLSLLAMEQEYISLAELSLSIEESLTYLYYSNISTNILNSVKNGKASAKRCIQVYDDFEKLLEAYYESMTAFMVTIDERENHAIIRMTIETPAGETLMPKGFDAQDVFFDEEMLSVTATLWEGGDAR